MPIHIFLLLIFISCTANASLDCTITNLESNLQPLFEAWSTKHVKQYTTLEENTRRMDIFKSRLEFMASVNSKSKHYCLGLNHFSDLTDEEFRAKYVGAIQTSYSNHSEETSFRYAKTEADSLPEWVDWRSGGAVTYVRNQGECRCCWAFSAIAAVEGLYHIKTGESLALSEQQLLDCMNAGCNPNLVTRAFDYISRSPITAESDYPYRALVGRCQEVNLEQRTVTIGSYRRIAPGDEYAIKAAVAKQPVSVAVEASGLEFRSYAKGIFDGECGTEIDHAVTLVGYGSENGLDYWIIKNSWGEEWGENGFMRLRRNLGDGAGKCGVAKDASFPTFV